LRQSEFRPRNFSSSMFLRPPAALLSIGLHAIPLRGSLHVDISLASPIEKSYGLAGSGCAGGSLWLNPASECSSGDCGARATSSRCYYHLCDDIEAVIAHLRRRALALRNHRIYAWFDFVVKLNSIALVRCVDAPATKQLDRGWNRMRWGATIWRTSFSMYTCMPWT